MKVFTNIFGSIFLFALLLFNTTYANEWEIWDSQNPPWFSSIRTVALEENGAVWVGNFAATLSGVYRYDPNTANWETWGLWDSGLPSNDIKEIVLDGEGTTWIGTFFDGLVRFVYDENDWEVHDTGNSELPNDRIRSLSLDGDDIWIGSKGGLTKFNYAENNWSTWNRSNSGLPGDTVRAIVIDGDIIWAGTMGGLARFDTASGT